MLKTNFIQQDETSIKQTNGMKNKSFKAIDADEKVTYFANPKLNRVRLGLPVNWPGPLKASHQDGIMGSACRTAFNNGINCEDFDAIGGYILGFYGCN